MNEIPWVVQATAGGRVFPEGDAPLLARTLEDLREDPVLREGLAANGRASVERLFGLEAVSALLDQVLSDISHAAPTTLLQ